MPIAIALGVDPALWFTAFTHLPRGVSEYDFAGGIRGEATETINGPYTGLPIPANAEIAIEGEILPGEMIDEGPFGEWHGYYANRGLEKEPEPVIHVKTVMHRNDPVFTGIQLAKPPHEYTLGNALTQSGTIWDALESCAVPGITGLDLTSHRPRCFRMALMTASGCIDDLPLLIQVLHPFLEE